MKSKRNVSVTGCGVLVAAMSLSSACLDESHGERAAAVVTPPPAPYVPTIETAARRFVILHTNDEHSHLLGFGPESLYPYLPTFTGDFVPDGWEVDDVATEAAIASRLGAHTDQQTTGGIVRRQFLINRERATARASDTPLLLLSAGDVMMGTLVHAAYAQNQAPDYLAMSMLGYDFIGLGNHEFDFGVDILASAITAAEQLTFGGAPALLASNIHFDDVTTGPGVALRDLYGDGNSGRPIEMWATKRLTNGLKVGFMALVGYNAALVAPNKAPIAFSTPLTGPACSFSDNCAPSAPSCVRGHCVDPLDAAGHKTALAADAQRVIDTLKNSEKVDVLVALTHLGSEEDNYLAENTTGIDVIIGGHSHETLPPYKVGKTIITQAGDYGRLLGRLTITVDENGVIDVDPAASQLIDVSSNLDAQILTAAAQGAVKTAAAFTGKVLGAFIGGLNEVLPVKLVNPVLLQRTDPTDLVTPPVLSIIEPIAGITSDHDVVGEVPGVDSYLTHLVTDAELDRVWNHKCDMVAPVVAVQANGVIRETLHFGPSDHKTTLDDVFRVVPLGGSPWEGPYAAPGYTVLKFKLTATDLMKGLDVGVTKGLESDSFFLSYSGMRTEYDTRRPPFNPGAAPGTTGQIVKIEIEDPPLSGTYAYTLYDANRTPQWKNSAGGTIDPDDPASFLITVVTNLYLGGFLDAFGLVPRDDNGYPMACQTPRTAYTCDQVLPPMERLAYAALCINPLTAAPLIPMSQYASCGSLGGPVLECYTVDPAGPPWQLAPELKEWEAVLIYLAGKGGLGTNEYRGASVPLAERRVRNVTP
ncbi:MAG: 5'-nucleotidase C-terminal domain-containing protein [Deltaproteobacteria bacterium]|nr:5'-nucleotidase C-terminal domain-containing protein [Deltaproteobacteria bacterium]